MILGAGVDIVDLTRFKKTFENPDFKMKFFSLTEQKLSIESLAGRFAAREAFYKALNRQDLYDRSSIEIINEENGKPNFVFYGELEKYSYDKKIFLTISHSPEYAVAFVIIEISALKN